MTTRSKRTASSTTPPGDQGVVRAVTEHVEIGRQRVETGKVRVTSRVKEHDQVVDEPVWRDEIEIERVPVDRVLESEAEATIRTEGDTTIVPVMEERLVVERQLVLKEEVHITKRRTSDRVRQTVTLKDREVVVARVLSDDPGQRNQPVEGEASHGKDRDRSISEPGNRRRDG